MPRPSLNDDSLRAAATPGVSVAATRVAGMGARLAAGGLAAGGLAARRRAGARSRDRLPEREIWPEPARAADPVWEPILPHAWAAGWPGAALRASGLWLARGLAADRWVWMQEARAGQALVLCGATALVLTLGLYWGKSRAGAADHELGRVIAATRDAKARIFLLQAEWAQQNDPGHLQPLVDHYLSLKKVEPSQFVQLAQLSERVSHPPPPPADPVVPDAMPEAVAGEAAEVAPPVTQAPEISRPAVVKPRLAAMAPAPHVLRVTARAPSPRLHEPAHAAWAAPLPHWLTAPPRTLSLSRVRTLPLAAPPPIVAHSYEAPARPSFPAPPPYMRGTYTSPYGSALAGPALPPPVPAYTY